MLVKFPVIVEEGDVCVCSSRYVEASSVMQIVPLQAEPRFDHLGRTGIQNRIGERQDFFRTVATVDEAKAIVDAGIPAEGRPVERRLERYGHPINIEKFAGPLVAEGWVIARIDTLREDGLSNGKPTVANHYMVTLERPAKADA